MSLSWSFAPSLTSLEILELWPNESPVGYSQREGCATSILFRLLLRFLWITPLVVVHLIF